MTAVLQCKVVEVKPGVASLAPATSVGVGPQLSILVGTADMREDWVKLTHVTLFVVSVDRFRTGPRTICTARGSGTRTPDKHQTHVQTGLDHARHRSPRSVASQRSS